MSKNTKILTYTPTKAILKLGRLPEVLNEREVLLVNSLLKKIENHQKGVK
jgi:hypothetical protein